MGTPLDADRQLIITEVRRFVDRVVIPVAHELEHSDTYPFELVEKLKQLGLFSATIPDDYGGAGDDRGPRLDFCAPPAPRVAGSPPVVRHERFSCRKGHTRRGREPDI